MFQSDLFIPILCENADHYIGAFSLCVRTGTEILPCKLLPCFFNQTPHLNSSRIIGSSERKKCHPWIVATTSIHATQTRTLRLFPCKVDSRTYRLCVLLPASITNRIVVSCSEVKCLPNGANGSIAPTLAVSPTCTHHCGLSTLPLNSSHTKMNSEKNT